MVTAKATFKTVTQEQQGQKLDFFYKKLLLLHSVTFLGYS